MYRKIAGISVKGLSSGLEKTNYPFVNGFFIGISVSLSLKSPH
jgi:hypothetical protein